MLESKTLSNHTLSSKLGQYKKLSQAALMSVFLLSGFQSYSQAQNTKQDKQKPEISQTELDSIKRQELESIRYQKIDTPEKLVQLKSELLEKMNKEREKVGLLPLHIDPILSKTAQKYAEYLGANTYFSHVSKDGKTLEDRLISQGYPTKTAGETLMADVNNNATLMMYVHAPIKNHIGMTHSIAHYKLLIDPSFEEVGIGIDPLHEKVVINYGTKKKTPHL